MSGRLEGVVSRQIGRRAGGGRSSGTAGMWLKKTLRDFADADVNHRRSLHHAVCLHESAVSQGLVLSADTAVYLMLPVLCVLPAACPWVSLVWSHCHQDEPHVQAVLPDRRR